MFKIFSLLMTVLVLLFGLALGVLNPTVVKFDAFFVVTELPLSILLAITLIIGGLIGVLALSAQVIRVRWQLKSQIRKNQKQSDQVVQLTKEITQFKVGQKTLLSE